MNSRWTVVLAILLASGCGVLHSQSYPSSSDMSDPTVPSQDQASPCTDPTTFSPDDCLQGQRRFQNGNQSGTNELQNTRTSRARSAEDTTYDNQYPSAANEKSRLRSGQLPPEPPTEFQKFVAATLGQVLPIYGANLFRDVPSTFAPNDIAPATADYVIGPDDELRVRIWGQVSYSGNLRVDRSGDIYLEGVGSVHVAGLPFSALDQHLRSAVSRTYRNFDLSVDMGRIRSIQVYVTGQARRPGAYTISSLSSLVDAVFASGGPSGQGSLRHIQLKRNGKTIADFDLYALLIRGDKSQDIRLLPEDVLYIPPVGHQVAISGSIHNPGIYELREQETVENLIDLAGGATTVAANARISLDRVAEHHLREAMEVSFDASNMRLPLADGDILRIFSILPAYQKTLTLRGNVANPGHFGWHAGMHLSDLIPDRDSLVSRDYWWKRNHLGLPSPEFEPLISSIGRDPRTPESTRAGFTTSVSQETLSSALSQNRRQDSQNTRSDSTSQRSEDATLNDRFSNGQSSMDRQANGQYAADPYGSDPYGSGSYGSNPSGSDPQAAGGALGSSVRQMPSSAKGTAKNEVKLSAPDIDWDYAVVERLNPDTLKTSLLPFDLGKLVLQHDVSQDLALEPGDTVTIFSEADIRVPLDQQTKYVTLEGEFVHAGVYSVAPGETLRDLVQRAGGLTSNAYLYGSEFDRESTRVLQQQRIDEYVNRVDLEAERGTLAVSSSATSSAGSLASTTGARAAEQDLISRLKQIRATGRIVLRLEPRSAGIDALPILGLENGDRFSVPPRPATVNVIGAVNDQNSFEFMQYGTTGQYLMMAGGQDRDADRGHSFIIRANGSVLGRSGTKGLWGDRFNQVRLNPGDTIVVPEKTFRPTALRGLLDWTQIFSQLAIGAAAVNVLR